MGDKGKNIGKAITQNIPNFLSISRIILAFVVIFLIVTNQSVIEIVFLFSLAAFTDFLDGQLARRFKWESEFGRKADVLADRFLWVGTAVAFLTVFGIEGQLKWFDGIQLMLIMSREIVSMPFALIAFFSGKGIPKVRFIAKVTTLFQGFALPSLILSIVYPSWIYLSLPLGIVCGITGFISAMYYIQDIKKKGEKV
ncbi:CDP-alcohol phosphatidyltransferase family protein [Candidatus Pacearchaeota archaeon]|nr:CDP-alcohol phosphatidyltransferase family protein [Candidatus Pacearchaeota archaeon]